MSLRVQIKLTSTWRQIIEFKDMEACEALSSTHPIELLNEMVRFLRGIFPNAVPDSCPIKPGKYFSNNTIFDSLGRGNSNIDKVFAAVTVGRPPNGQYRAVGRIYNAKDPIGGTVWAMTEFYESNSNATNF